MVKLILIFLINLSFLTSSFGQHRTVVKPILVDSSFDDISLLKLNEAVSILTDVVNSELFCKKVLETKFEVGNYGLTSAEILEIIQSGVDNYTNKPKDFSIDLRLMLFDKYQGQGNFGTTNMGTRITRTHRCYVLNNDVKCYVSHLAHEYMHQIGFYDVKSWSGLKRTKINSIPYKIGSIVDKVINNKTFCVAQKTTCNK